MCQNDSTAGSTERVQSACHSGIVCHLWQDRKRVLLILLLGAPGLLCSPLHRLLPVPCRLLLGFLWVTVPMGRFLLRRSGDFGLPRSVRWATVCLLGWCGAAVLTLITSFLGGSWLVLGALIGGCGLIAVLCSSEPSVEEAEKSSPSSLPILLVLVTLLALVYTLKVGGYMAEDGRYHLAYLLEVQNREGPGAAHPFLDSNEFDPRYAISSYHSLLAFLANFARLRHMDVWFYAPSLWLLLAIGGWQLFGVRILGSRLGGDLCAIFFLLLALIGFPGESVGLHELRTLAYPGGFSLHVLFPALIAWSWKRSVPRFWSIAPILLIAITLSTTHLFYSLLALLVLGAGLLGLAVFVGRGGLLKRIALSTAVAFMATSPVLIWSWLHYVGVKNPVFVFDTLSSIPHDYSRRILLTGGGMFILHPLVWLTLTGLNICSTNAPVIGLLSLLLFWTKTKPECRAFFAGIVTVLIALMSTPPLFVGITRAITLYKSFRLFQALPVVPLLAIGVQGISIWVVTIRRKASRGYVTGDSHPWVPVLACLAVFVLIVPSDPSRISGRARIRLLWRSWQSVQPWWRQPYRDFTDPTSFRAFQEIASKNFGGTILAEPHAGFAYAALFGGKVVAIPDFHAAPTSTDITERIQTVEAIRTGWFNSQELRSALQKYKVGTAFFRWSRLSPLAEATLSTCLKEEILIPAHRPRLQSENDYRKAYAVFHKTPERDSSLEPVFVDLEVKQGEPYRLRRDGTIWGPTDETVASVAPFLSQDTAERFKFVQNHWIIATRSGRLLTPNGENLELVSSGQSPQENEEKPIAILLSESSSDLFVLGDRGSWWTTKASGLDIKSLPNWRKATLCAAARDPRGGILSVSVFGGVLSFGQTWLSQKNRTRVPAHWGRSGINMATGLALDPSGTCLYLLTRVGDIYRIQPGTSMKRHWKSNRANRSIWLALAAQGDHLLAMDWRGRVLRVPLRPRSADS